MKMQFRCAEHKVDLIGEPVWYTTDKRTWEPDLSNMSCSASKEDECNSYWKVVLV
jgi:hypothetical protein